MNDNDLKTKKPIEIYINTIGPGNEKEGLQEGIKKTSARLDMMYHTTRVKVSTDNEETQKEAPFLEKLLQKTNSVIETVVTNMSKTVENENIKSIEFEFGIAFSEKLDIVLFQTGAEQSIKFKVIVQK